MSAATTEDPTVGSPPLSRLLRDGSASQHRAAEGESFVRELLAGRVTPGGYLQLLLRLTAVYGALESVGTRLAGDRLAGPFVDPALHRLHALTDDVAFWWAASDRRLEDLDLGTAVDLALASSPATRTYVDRVQASTAWGGLYVAHHYTRYLGDLSGGQAISRVLGRSFGLRGDEGLRFFSFDAVPKAKPYKDGYRARLDAMPVDVAGRERMLVEVRDAFALNAALFRELDAAPATNA